MRPALSIFSSKRFRQAVSILTLLALLASGLGFLSRSLRMNDGYYRFTPFLTNQQEYDVLFFGTSHVVDSVNPMQLWAEQGITSYNLAIHGGSIASSYWMLRMALEYKVPKIAVMEVVLTRSNRMQTDLPMSHAAMDPFPLTKTKIQAICDIYPDTADRMEMLFPLDVFHNRWKELDGQMLKRGLGITDVSPEKGGESLCRVYPLENPLVVPFSDAAQEKTEGLRYLEKFILLCQERGITPVITYLPYRDAGSTEEQRYCNAALLLAQSLGAVTVDLQHTDLVDDETDWYDPGSHMNLSGAKKVTRVLGEYLKEHYDLADHRQDPAWAEDYEAYYAFQAENLHQAEGLWEMLTVLSVEDFTARVEISGDYPMDGVTEKLLASLGNRLERVTRQTGGTLTLTVYGKDGAELVTRRFQTEPTGIE